MWVGGSRGYASITFPKALWVLYSVQFCMLTCLRTGFYLLIENMGNTAEEDKRMWVPECREKGWEMPSSGHDNKAYTHNLTAPILACTGPTRDWTHWQQIIHGEGLIQPCPSLLNSWVLGNYEWGSLLQLFIQRWVHQAQWRVLKLWSHEHSW